MKRQFVSATLTATILMSAGVALAQSSPQNPRPNPPQTPPQDQQLSAVMQACAADFQTLCSGVEPGGGRMKQCLVQNRRKISAPCKQALKDARAAKSQ
jgi:hypothetical protein